MNYVLGFIFSPKAREVLLIRKNRPEWQEGLLNGIGGKIEEDETPLAAMVRECGEETTAIIPWMQYGILEGEEWRVSLFYGFSSGRLSTIKALTDEGLEIVRIDALPNDVIPNLNWLIPMALKDSFFYHISQGAQTWIS